MVRPARNRRKQLTPQSLSGVAEVCETRSLLCATGFEAPVDLADAAVIDVSEVNSDVVSSDDGTVTEEMVFGVTDAGIAEEDFQFAMFKFMPMVVGETEEYSPDLTEKSDAVEEATLVEEATEFVEYEVDAMPIDWNPSWGYRLLSMTAAPVEEMNGEVPAELQDTEITGEIVDLSLLESIALPVIEDMMMYTMTIEDSLNPDDLLATCFSAPPTDELVDSTVEPGVEEVELKEDIFVATEFVGEPVEDWTSISPEILMTMVMRGSVPEAGSEEIVFGETGDDGSVSDNGVVTLEGEEIWQTGVVDGNEDFPQILYMFGAADGGEPAVVDADGVSLDGETVTGDVTTLIGDAFVTGESLLPEVTPEEETVTGDAVPADSLLQESSDLIFQTAVLDDTSADEPTMSTPNAAVPPFSTSEELFVDHGDVDNAIGTLLSRSGSQTGPASTAAIRTSTGPSTRTAPKFNAVVSRRAAPPASQTDLSSPLGNSDLSESHDLDSDDAETTPDSANSSSSSETSNANAQRAANTAATPVNQTRSIDLFMSRFHDEFFAG